MKGQRLKAIVLVQNGLIRIRDGKAVKDIVVCRERVKLAPGQTWQASYIIGVRSILYDIGFSMSVEVHEGMVQAWVLNCDKGDAVLPEGMGVRRILQLSTFTDLLIQLTMFKDLKRSDPRFWRLINFLQSLEYWEQEDIIVQGDKSTSIFILIEGCVSVIVGDKEISQLTADLDRHKAHYFGELAFLDDKPRGATVRIKSATASLLEVTRDMVVEAFGSIATLVESQGRTLESVLREEMLARGKDITEQVRKSNIDVMVVEDLGLRKGQKPDAREEKAMKAANLPSSRDPLRAHRIDVSAAAKRKPSCKSKGREAFRAQSVR